MCYSTFVLHLACSQVPLSSVTSIIDGLKRLYIQKLKPLEVTYRFNDFVSPLLVSTHLNLILCRILVLLGIWILAMSVYVMIVAV